MATLSIGLNQSSTLVVSDPTGREKINISIKHRKVINEYLNGNRELLVFGNEKQDFTLSFEKKSKSQFEQIKNFCNTPFQYFVELKNNASVVLIAGNFFIELAGVSIEMVSDNPRYDFSVKFTQV